MHIPTCQTQELEILTFEQALVPTQWDFDREKWLYIPDHYAEYRYLLGTRGENPLICIGINPSTAVPGDLDNTLKSVERIAAGNGYDSFLMFNVYAQRATRPEDMDAQCNQALHRENMTAFRYVLSQVGAGFTPAVWAAWGTIIEKTPLSPGLCPGHGRHRGGIRRPVALRGEVFQEGASSPPAVSAKRGKGPGFSRDGVFGSAVK